MILVIVKKIHKAPPQ